MYQAISPDALDRSKEFRKVSVGELKNPKAKHEEAFVFVFPSPDPLNADNGDGSLIEIINWNDNLTTLWIEGWDTMPVLDGMQIYVR